VVLMQRKRLFMAPSIRPDCVLRSSFVGMPSRRVSLVPVSSGNWPWLFSLNSVRLCFLNCLPVYPSC
jgi:hypothetical protein